MNNIRRFNWHLTRRDQQYGDKKLRLGTQGAWAGGITSTAFLRRMSSSTSQFTDEVDAERAPMSAPPPPLRGRVTKKGKGAGVGDAGGLGFSWERRQRKESRGRTDERESRESPSGCSAAWRSLGLGLEAGAQAARAAPLLSSLLGLEPS